MQFMNPLYFLLVLLIAAVVFFYFFRKQYEETLIPSNLLWKEVMNEWQASPFLKKLQQNLLFWLQVLALLLLMLALARPFWYEDRLKGEHIVFIVDSSATMSAGKGEEMRFEQAKKELKKLAETLQSQEVTLIRAGQKPEFILNHESDRRTVLKAIDALELSYDHENIEKALNLAESVSANSSTSLYVFSDSVTKDNVKNNDQYLEVHNFGRKLENVSLTSFGVGYVNGQVQAVAVIENQSSLPKKVSFTIMGKETVLFSQEIAIDEKDSFVLTIPELSESPYYEAAIESDDGYAADNKVTAVYTDPSPGIYALGEINPFVTKGFKTLGVELIQQNSESDEMDGKGILLLEGTSIEDIPDMPVILFNNSNEKIELTEAARSKDDPLLEYVQPGKMYVSTAREAIAESGLETVLASGNQPLIQKGIRNGEPFIVVNFSLADSDWPLHPDFPIFLYNCYQWLIQHTGFLGYFNPGEEKWLNTSSDTSVLEIYNNQDENLFSIDTAKEAFLAPALPGTYQAVANEEIYFFSVLIDEREKEPASSPSFTLNDAQQGEEKGDREQPNEFLIIVLSFLALLLIAVEWEVYRRGFRA